MFVGKGEEEGRVDIIFLIYQTLSYVIVLLAANNSRPDL